MKQKMMIIFLVLTAPFILIAHPKIEFSGESMPFQETMADSAHGFDVLHYHISMAINDAQEYIEGSVTATVLLEEDLSVIEYELVGLDVDDVQLNGEPASYTFNGSEISIEIDSINPGEEFTTVVAYSGNPILCNVPYALGMFFTTSGIYTISDPNASRYWWPCYDHPWDKAETDLEITVRSDWNVATNGVRTNIIDNGDGTKTHFWDGQNQIATYLVSIVTRVLVELTDDYNGIPIHNFVPPNLEDEAEIDLSGLPEMMEIYTNKYGEYPFEKYGNAVTSFSTYGAMEHQTMTTLASYLITGNHTYDVVIAHELSHQWFGDCLTPLTWKDVWLSEGFATYSEAIFIEETQGYQAMLDYVNSNIQSYYLSWAGGSSYTIYDPAYNSLFTPVTYEKAASILHILRAMFGNEMFFEVLQEYFQTFHNGNVITDDFQMICENVSGQDLEQFFQQWIYQPGIPSFEYTYFLNQSNNELMTMVKSSSTSGTDFHVQLPVKILYQDATDSLLVSAAPDSPMETIVELSESEIIEISLDPDNWIINRGKVFHQAAISGGYPGNHSALIFWGDFWAEIEIDGFNLYRSDSPEGEYEQVNEEPIVSGYYLDTDLVNDQAYYYKVKAVKNEQFESPLSDWVEVIPQLMEFDQGILVIDETLDGNGNPGNPDDEMVDLFYDYIIDSPYTGYDYGDQGSPELAYLGNYSTVIWHDDDMSMHQINNNLPALSSFVAGGGNLFISGWKTASLIDPEFLGIFFSTETVDLINDFEFIGALSDIYPDLEIDPGKVNPVFNGKLPFISVFPDALDGIYTYHGSDGSSHEGKICALKSTQFGSIFLLGFPLYYCYENGAQSFMQQVLAELGETGSNQDELIPTPVSIHNSPNPFNPDTEFYLQLPESQHVKISIFNLKGQLVDVLVSEDLTAGNHQFTWRGIDNRGEQMPSGIYLYQLETGKSQLTGKMILLK